MKKLLYKLFFLFLFISNVATAQERVQSISTGISKLGVTKSKMSIYLASLGFSFNNSSGNIIDYSKNVQFGSYSYMVGYKGQTVNTVAWTEYIANLQNVLSEIKSMGFDDGQGFNDSKMYNFKNYNRNITLILIVREDMNDFQITLGKLNPNQSTGNSHQSAVSATPSVVEPSKRFKSYFVNIPNPPKDIAAESSNKVELTFHKDYQPDVRYGVIQKIDKDNDDDGTINLQIVTQNDHKGYIYMDVVTSYFTPDFSYPGSISKADYNNFKAITVLGRRVKFYIDLAGSGAMEHIELMYIKALPASTIEINNRVVIDKEMP